MVTDFEQKIIISFVLRFFLSFSITNDNITNGAHCVNHIYYLYFARRRIKINEVNGVKKKPLPSMSVSGSQKKHTYNYNEHYELSIRLRFESRFVNILRISKDLDKNNRPSDTIPNIWKQKETSVIIGNCVEIYSCYNSNLMSMTSSAYCMRTNSTAQLTNRINRTNEWKWNMRQ